MKYRAVGNRVAIDFPDLDLPLSEDEAIRKLCAVGFNTVRTTPVELALEQVGRAAYRRGAMPWEAPGVFDCSSLIKWVFGTCGVWLPRRTVQQRECGEKIVGDAILPGDAVYRTGRRNWFRTDPREGVGHVGLYVGDQRVVHAANSRDGVVEVPFEEFLGTAPGAFRGTRRFLGPNARIFECPGHIDVETSDDIRWILLSRLARS